MESDFIVRCTCNKVLQNFYPTYEIHRKNGLTVEAALDKLRIRKMCCRTRFRCFVANLGEGYPSNPFVIDEENPSIREISDTKIGKEDAVYDD